MSPVKKELSRGLRGPPRGVETSAPAFARAGNKIQQIVPGTKPSPEWKLRHYIAGRTTTAEDAISNLQRLCEEYLAGQYCIEVIDLLQRPQLAAGDQIIAVPRLVRKLPTPVKRIIGDLSNRERVLGDWI